MFVHDESLNCCSCNSVDISGQLEDVFHECTPIGVNSDGEANSDGEDCDGTPEQERMLEHYNAALKLIDELARVRYTRDGKTVHIIRDENGDPLDYYDLFWDEGEVAQAVKKSEFDPDGYNGDKSVVYLGHVCIVCLWRYMNYSETVNSMGEYIKFFKKLLAAKTSTATRGVKRELESPGPESPAKRPHVDNDTTV